MFKYLIGIGVLVLAGGLAASNTAFAQTQRNVYIEAVVPSGMEAEQQEEMEYRLESLFALYLKLNFSCVTVLTRSVFRNDLRNDFEQASSGSGSTGSEQFGRLCKYDYLLKIHWNSFESGASHVAAQVFSLKPAKVVGEASLLGRGMDVAAVAKEVAGKLVEDLSANEFCPFKGTLTIDQTDKQEVTEKVETPVVMYDPVRKQMCTGTSTSTFTRTEEMKTHWEIQRVGKGASVAGLQSELTEFTEEKEENDCYTCASGRVGGRIWNRTTIKRFAADSVSAQSPVAEGNTNDARIEIQFQDDSTYVLLVKATSEFEKNCTITIRETAKGTCDSKDERQTMETSNSLFLKSKLGPFKGTNKDTELSGSGTVQLPVTTEGEHSELVYSFRFSR